MKTNFFVIFFVFAAIFLAGCSGSGGGGGGGACIVNGTIVDLDYLPVSNATVTTGTNTTNSLSNGKYSFVNIPSGEKIIKISPSSHTSSYRKVAASGGTTVNADIAIVANLDSKTTPIPSTGGTATNTNGSIKIKFPSGAFISTTNIVLTAVPAVASPYSPPASKQFISYIVYAKPEDQELVSPKTATLSVPNLTSVTTEAVAFYLFDPATLNWNFIANGYASTESHTINVEITKLGWVAAIIPINPAPGQISGVVSNGTSPIPNVNVWTTTSFAVTNSLGQYTLSYIPQGTHEVKASALNYQPYTSPAVAVTSLNTTTHNFIMSTLPQGNIAGTVFSNQTGLGIQNAWLSETNGGIAYTDTYGRYTFYNVLAGGTTVVAHASGHVISSESVTVLSGSTANQDFHLPYVGAASSYTFDFDSSDDGFTHTGGKYFGTTVSDFWHRQEASTTITGNPLNYFNTSVHGQTQKVFLPDSGYLPAQNNGLLGHYFWYGRTTGSSTYEGSYIGFQDISDIISTFEGTGGESDRTTFLFQTPHSLMGTLESPELNLAGYLYGKLSFWTWWEIEGKNPATGYDMMLVLVSQEGASGYTMLGALNPWDDPAKDILFSGEAYTSGGYDEPGLWVKHTFDLSSYAGKKIRIRFVFDTFDTHYNGYRGWIIDDVKVEDAQYGVSSNRTRPFIMVKPRN